MDWLLDPRLLRQASADRVTRILVAVGHVRPAIVLARLRVIELVATLGAMFHRPQFPGLRMDGRALQVAMADGPDFGKPACDLGIVRRNAAVLGHADHLADVIVGLLHQLAQVKAVAGGDEQRTRPVEGEASAKMGTPLVGGLLAEDDFNVSEAAKILGQAPAHHARAVLALLARFREGEEHEPRLREIRMKCDVEEPALVTCGDLRQAGDRIRQLPVGTDGAEVSGAFGDENRPVRQEGEGPRMVKTVGHGLQHLARLGAGTQWCQRNGEKACDNAAAINHVAPDW